jgi:PAS domain S-box-containing protein
MWPIPVFPKHAALSFLELVPDAALIIDSSGRIVGVNAQAAAVLGYSSEELVGESVETLVPEQLRERHVHHRTGFSSVARKRAMGEAADLNALRKDGSSIPVTVSLSPLDTEDGRLVLGVLRDLTERKEAEARLEESRERYRALLGNLPGAAFRCTLDENWTMQFVSEKIVQLSGYPASDFIGNAARSFASIIHPDDRASVDSVVRAEEEEGRDYAIEYRIITADGETRWVHEQGSVSVAEGGTDFIEGVILDADARKLAEEDRDRLEVELRHSQKLDAVGQLAAGIAHEINTPMQFVSDTIEFLHDSLNDVWRLLDAYRETCSAVAAGPAGVTLLEHIHQLEEEIDLPYLEQRMPAAFDRTRDGIGRVTTIVKAMRAFAHPDRKETSEVDLNEALATTLVVARNEIKYVAEVTTEFGALPPVRCHIGDLNQVFLNLLVNAAHAIEAKWVSVEAQELGTITVSTRLDGADALVEISDTGCGIPDDIREKVFDPFFTTKEVGRGSGQGLAIARAIVTETHGGSLTVASTLGEGTTFSIRLPVAGPNSGSEGRLAA